MNFKRRSTVTALAALVALVVAQGTPAAVAAEQAAPANGPPPPPPGYAPPPPGYYPPPPGYAPPPPGYYPPPPYAYPPPGAPRPRPPRRPKGLLIAGPIVLGATYAFTALAGLVLISHGDGTQSDGTVCLNCETQGTRLLVPILGPWLALPAANGSDGKTFSALMGLAQATGVLLTVIGISRYSASAPDGTVASRGLHFAFIPRSGGGAFGVLGASF
ncbi:MAG TPA: hypothetical protein VMU50_01310 [Polyangia bacterium]|nr:hypothetical protein [Polyangia bacterium]